MSIDTNSTGVPPEILAQVQEAAERTAKGIRDNFDALKHLKDGWNSYSAPAPSQAAIENAEAFVQEADRLGTTVEFVEPSAIGGVGVTFSFGHREVVIEFYNKGTAHALFSDDANGDMRTQAVPTNRDGFLAVLGEVCKYLYGE